MMRRGLFLGIILFAAGVLVGLLVSGAGSVSAADVAPSIPAYYRSGRFPEVGEQLRAKANQHIGADSWYPHNVMQWNDRLFIDVRQPALGYSDKLIQWVFVFRWDGEFWRLEENYQADPG